MTLLNSSSSSSYNSSDGAGPGILGLMGLAGLIYLGSSTATVFAASLGAGFAVVAVVAVTIALTICVCQQRGWQCWSFFLLIGTTLWAALGGAIVFQHHWLAFTPAAWVLNGLFVAALVSGAWSAAAGWLKALAALFAAALVAATMLLPRPAGGEGPYDTNEEWKINVTVVDSQQEPLEGAFVLCQAVLSWDKDTPLELSESRAQTTDRDGRVPAFEFDEDPRMKVVVCTVWKNADEGNAGYPPVFQFVYTPRDGGEYDLRFELKENPHPEVAYLQLDLRGSWEQSWYHLHFELWPGEPETSYVGSHEGPLPLASKVAQEFRGSAFAIPAYAADADLHLRYTYEGPSGPDLGLPRNEMRTIPIGPIPVGTRRKVMLVIPQS